MDFLGRPLPILATHQPVEVVDFSLRLLRICLYCVNSASGLKQEDDIIYYATNVLRNEFGFNQ